MQNVICHEELQRKKHTKTVTIEMLPIMQERFIR